MPLFSTAFPYRRPARPGWGAATLLLLALQAQAQVQSSCSSDGQPAPRALVERFIADHCDRCWRGPAAAVADGTLPLDWIVPGGDEQAPLATAATRDALDRLAATATDVPADATRRSARVAPTRRQALRVAMGPPVNDYIGTSIAWTPAAAPRQNHTAWLLLVEMLPAGSEGSRVARQLVRNALVLDWRAGQAAPGAPPPGRFSEARPMRIAEGADPRRLRVVGWVEDAQGRIVAAAASRCAPARTP